MEWIISFVLGASVYLLLFALAYSLLLSRRIHPTFNRFYLLVSALLSLILANPGGIMLDWGSHETGRAAITLPEIIITASESYNHTTSNIVSGLGNMTLLHWIFAIFSTGIAAMMLWQIIRLVTMAARSGHRMHNGLRLVELPANSSPFSFFSWVFCPRREGQQIDFDKVMAHERAHWQRLHSVDVVFFELLRILFWFHPAFYYMRHELRAMHEFEADSLVLQQFDLPDYQLSLLETAIGGSLIPITNPYNVSLIKKRMIMMNREVWQKPARNWFKIMLLLPFLVAAVAMQSCRFNQQEQQNATQTIEPPAESATATAPAQSAEMANATDSLFTVVEVMPEYPGGTEAMMKFLAENIQYPEEARKKQVQGPVYVNFVVEKDGSVGEVKILKGIGNGCDDEAMRVVKMMPAWKPGTQRGQTVRVSFNLPVRFKLS